MAEYKGLSGKSYRTQNAPFAGGGEGDVYDVVGAPGYVAKVYKPDKRTTERERKLSVMVSNKPSVMEQYAWPLDVLYENGQFIGYIMPKINGKEKLRNIYVYDKRKGKPWSLFIAIAKNLSAAVHNVHEIHQVVGDLNPENILVNPNDGMVTLVDTDSYHISDSSRTYRCGVGMPEFVAPELQGIHFPSAPLPTFTPESDRFALAVLIFALLMNGAHPFSCKVISGSSSKFQPIDNMQNGKCAFFPDSRSSNMDIPRYAPDLSSLPDNIQKLFRRAFVAGHSTPSLRPSAEEWYNALEQLEDNLKTCLKDTQHIYYYGAKECPWCKVNEKMHSISQSAFNSSSQSGSNSGSGSQPATAGGQAQQFTPSNYRYTPSTSGSGTQKPAKRYGGWIAIGVAVIVLILIIRSCSSGGNSGKQNSDYPTQNIPASTQNETSNQGTSTPNNNSQAETVRSTIESGFEVEDNNTYSMANDILVNNTYSGSLSDSYSTEQDWYRFTIDKSGVVNVSFYTKNQSSSSEYWDVSVRSGSNPDQDIWQSYIKGNSTETSSGSLFLNAGTYYFEVESANQHTADTYSFSIEYSDTVSKIIEPIADSPINVDAINNIEDTVSALSIGSFSGSVSSDGQKNDHSFSPVVSGTYRFEFADIADGVDFRLWVCNSNGDTIKSDYDMDTGDGITVSLDSGSNYIIRVGQYHSYGSYNLIIGEQKPTVDISNLTKVSDSIQYTDQENNYLFSPSVSGTYRFEYSDVPDGTDLRLYVFNSGWETIKSDYDMDNGDGLTVTLEAGKSYYIRTKQYRSLGSYSLIIGRQKDTVDVTSYTMLSDSIQYTEQRNNYRLVAGVAGTYRFEFANVPDGTDLRLYVYNSGWETIKSDYDMDTGDGLTVSLSEGQEIYITVSQYRALGSYSLVLGAPKPTVEISDVDQISDSVQYTEQRNVYLFEAKTAGKYSFTFSSVPDGVDYRMQIYNSGWESIKSDYDMDSGDGLSLDLSQGQKVYVCVSQYRGTGGYSMIVSRN